MRNKVATRGFTLIEVIAGLLALAISFTLMATLLFPQAQRSVDPIHQTRATQLASTLLSEISGKAFDHCSNHDGITLDSDCSNNPRGSFRCGEGVSCTPASALGPEGETRDQFNDVDDYHGLVLQGSQIQNALGESLGDLYNNFRVTVQVDYVDALGPADVNGVTALKRIRLAVTTPNGEQMWFETERGNY